MIGFQTRVSGHRTVWILVISSTSNKEKTRLKRLFGIIVDIGRPFKHGNDADEEGVAPQIPGSFDEIAVEVCWDEEGKRNSLVGERLFSAKMKWVVTT